MKTTSTAAALLLTVQLLSARTAGAQQLPIPGQKNPAWILSKMEQPTHEASGTLVLPMPEQMPALKVYGGTTAQHGNWRVLYDPQHRLRYFLTAHQRGIVGVESFETGACYIYERKSPVRGRQLDEQQ